MAEVSRRTLIVAVGGGTAAAAFGLAHPLGPGGLDVGRRHRTSFGSVTLLGSARSVTTSAGGHHTALASHVASGADVPVASRVHGAWRDAVTVEVEVRNERNDGLLLSPGQLRLRLDRDGLTVSLYGADRDAGVLAPGSSATMRVTFLAPPPDRQLSVEFDDPGAGTTLVLGRVGGSTARMVRA